MNTQNNKYDNILSYILLIVIMLLGTFLFSDITFAANDTCFCHNDVTICTSDQGLLNGHSHHDDTMEACECLETTKNDQDTDCQDLCPDDPTKTQPGICGCGIDDIDTDGDNVSDCNDACPNDGSKTEEGVCGCGLSDADSDGDGIPDCNDLCEEDPSKSSPGDCGCGEVERDSDSDGIKDCHDICPTDPTNDADKDGICDNGYNESQIDLLGEPGPVAKLGAGGWGCILNQKNQKNISLYTKVLTFLFLIFPILALYLTIKKKDI